MSKTTRFLIILTVGIICLWIFSPLFSLTAQQKLVSPWISRGRSASNLWFPIGENNNLFGIVKQNTNPPEITAKSAYFVDTNSGEILYQKNPHQKLPIASLTKVMTAVIALENMDWKNEVTISKRAATTEPDKMFLKAGEKFTVEDLMYGIFLISANDGAEALAENIIGGREEFISQMNKKCAQLSMKNTVFINPTGLEEDDQDQYSTAYDVVLMSRYAIKQFPHLVDISRTTQKILPKSFTHQDYNLVSGINLISTYPGIKGFKTGFTPRAGLTLVTLVEREGHEVLGVLLNTETRREDARKLLDYSFKKLGVQI